ncbi:hypothetical protein IMZ48_40080 [Candidatus Bathyarchaeota archaeon]|nr:hypothetical protein [Candidatus Bathyarchaeota archaeon]
MEAWKHIDAAETVFAMISIDTLVKTSLIAIRHSPSLPLHLFKLLSFPKLIRLLFQAASEEGATFQSDSPLPELQVKNAQSSKVITCNPLPKQQVRKAQPSKLIHLFSSCK